MFVWLVGVEGFGSAVKRSGPMSVGGGDCVYALAPGWMRY
jgi:hypothetical protein